MSTATISPRGSVSPGGERCQRFTNAAMAGGRVSSAKHHSFSSPETFARKPSSASGQYIPGAYPESVQSPAPVKVGVGRDEQATHAGHDHRPTLKVDLPTHEEPSGAREGVGSLPGPNNARGVAILPDEKEPLLDAPHKSHYDKDPGLKTELPSSEEPTGSRVGIGSMPGSNSESGVATLPEERIDGRPYGQGHTGFEKLDGGKQMKHREPTNHCSVSNYISGLDNDTKGYQMSPHPGEMDSHLATQVQRSTGGKITENKAHTQRGEMQDTTIIEMPREVEEAIEVPEFLEGGFDNTAAGKYEAVFKPALPRPDESATSKALTKPSGPFTQTTVSRQPVSAERQAVEDRSAVPVFIEGGIESILAGGKYEAVFESALPPPGKTTESQPAPGSVSYLGKPVSKEEEMAQVEQARRMASRKAAGIN